MPPLPYTIVDAFSPSPFGGNPASVLIFGDSEADQKLAGDEKLMQQIAAEFNLSATAVARRMGGNEEEPEYELRWRTPTSEVVLCGHATLATAHVLFPLHPAASSIRFVTRFSGALYARRLGDLISLNFPAADLLTLENGHRRRPKIVGAVLAATGLKEESILRVVWYDGSESPVVELAEDVDLEGLKVDFPKIEPAGRTVILTQPAPASSEFDIYSRIFGPAVGINEDPVTGSAHTALCPSWLSPESISRLHNADRVKQSRTIRAKQVSKRGGEIDCVLSEDGKRVELRGKARTVMKGEILLD
ncbi:hypothetical protein JCM10213_000197 [Rhodosporidiobolus nylandii]